MLKLFALCALAQAAAAPVPAPAPAPAPAAQATKSAVPTPDEVKAAISAGEGVKVMENFFHGMTNNDPNIIIEHGSGRVRDIFQLVADSGVKMPAEGAPKTMSESAGEGNELGNIIVDMAGSAKKAIIKRGADGKWRFDDVRRLGKDPSDSSIERDLLRAEKSLTKGLAELGKKLEAEAVTEGSAQFPEKPAAVAVEFTIFREAGSLPFQYAGALAMKGKEKKVLACLASPYHGKRGILWSDLSSDMIPEEDFKKLAFAAGKIKAPALDGELTAQVNTLVAQLGANGAKERRDARKALIALGLPAIKPLKAHFQHSDPEVAETVKEIVETIHPTPSPPPPKEDDAEVHL